MQSSHTKNKTPTAELSRECKHEVVDHDIFACPILFRMQSLNDSRIAVAKTQLVLVCRPFDMFVGQSRAQPHTESYASPFSVAAVVWYKQC